jgi:hypothetical protein
MIRVSYGDSLKRLSTALGNSKKKIRKEMAIVLNAVAKRTQNTLAKEISKELATSQKSIKQTIKVTKKASSVDLAAKVSQDKSDRIPLKYFAAKQNKTGVSYKISKTKGRKTVKSAFVSDKLGRHVYKRRAKTRLPIDKLHGPSPWGVTVKNELAKKIVNQDVEPELVKQIERRIRAINFKKSEG